MKSQKQILIYIFLFGCIINSLNCQIRFSFEMFRHGARGPWTKLDKDNRDVFGEEWTGNGELTGVGMRQHYLLGHRNRIKYQNFLSQNYDPKEVYVVSTDLNRTIMSAMSQLQGLYSYGYGPELTQQQQDVALPPVNHVDFDQEKLKLGNSSLPNQLQVVPMHLFDLNAKRFQLFDKRNCPNVETYINKNLEKQVYKDYYVEFNQTFGEKLKSALNVTDPNYFFNYENVYSIADTFVSDYTEGHKLEKLTNAGIDLALLNKTAFDFLYMDNFEYLFGDKDNYLGRMSMSPTMQDIVTWMDDRINNDIKGLGFLGYPSPKLVMYSAHDTTMGAIQSYLKAVFNTSELFYTPFASSIFIDLYRRVNVNETLLNNEDYYVLVEYNDHILFNVTYSEFKSTIQKQSVDAAEIADFCGFSPKPTAASIDPYAIATVVLAMLSIGLIGYVGFTCTRKNREEPTIGYNSV